MCVCVYDEHVENDGVECGAIVGVGDGGRGVDRVLLVIAVA